MFEPPHARGLVVGGNYIYSQGGGVGWGRGGGRGKNIKRESLLPYCGNTEFY